MSQIKAAEVAKLRKATGAGMMDCKNALVEANGDFDKAIETIRKRGQAIANKRADKEASEGVVIAKARDDNKKGIIVALNCETDFVAKNDDFVLFANQIADTALANNPSNIEDLLKLTINDKSIDELVTEKTGVVGEKVELTFYDKLEAEFVTPYIHLGSKLATLVGMNKRIENLQVGKDVAMQVAAMNPVSVSKDNVPEEIIQKEIEIGKGQAREQGKPEELLEKIAMGKLNKFYKESTLLSQDFIKDGKKSVQQYLQEADKELTVTEFLRYTLTN